MAVVRLVVLDNWLTAHHGVISKTEAARLGIGPGSWYRALERGQLELLHRNVARAIGSPRTPEQAIRAGVLAMGPSAVASHRSAARLWGFERRPDDPVDVIVPRSVSRRMAGVVVHRPTDEVDLTTSLRAGIPCTNLLRTLVDLGAVTGGVAATVESAVASGVVSPTVLRALLDRHARSGRAGVGALRRTLERWPLDHVPDSVLEVAMARLLQRHGLPPAEFHPSIAGYVPDFRLIGTPILIECDGWEFHGMTRAQFERDRERDQALAAAGYVVVHLTWRQITKRASQTAARLRALVERWSSAE